MEAIRKDYDYNYTFVKKKNVYNKLSLPFIF